MCHNLIMKICTRKGKPAGSFGSKDNRRFAVFFQKVLKVCNVKWNMICLIMINFTFVILMTSMHRSILQADVKCMLFISLLWNAKYFCFISLNISLALLLSSGALAAPSGSHSLSADIMRWVSDHYISVYVLLYYMCVK